MPYDNVPESKWGEMDQCVEAVMADGTDEEAAVAICYASVVEGKSLPEVKREFLLDAAKIGMRNNRADRERVRKVRTLAREIEGVTKEIEPDDADPEPEQEQVTHIAIMSAPIKALGDGRVGGYLVRFTGPDEPDLTGEYFTKDTDFDIDLPGQVRAYFHHGLNDKLKRLSHRAEVKLDDTGLWAETLLDERNEYEAYLLRLATDGKLGWSSGAVGHLVEYEPGEKSTRIKAWPIGEASLTHVPAEPRNVVIPLKSLSEYLPAPELPEARQGSAAQEADVQLSIKSTNKEKPMSDNPELITTTKEDLAALVKGALEDYTKSLPPVNVTPAQVAVVQDEADRPFKSLGEQCLAVKNATVSMGRSFDPRLKRLELKAGTGANEAVPSQGGYLLEPEFAGYILEPLGKSGEWPFSADITMYNTMRQSGWGWGIDETSRATGSRYGGIQGYRVAEGDSITATKPKFRKINWALNKYVAAVYATDELLADAPMFAGIVQQGCSEELGWLFNYDILNGTGVGGALGVLNTSAYVAVSAESGQSADTIVYENLTNMWSRLHPRCKPNAKWYVNTDCLPELYEMGLAVGTGALEPRFMSFGNDGSMQIFGKPVVETEFNPTLGDLGDIMVADMSWYLGWQKAGVEAASSIHVQFMTDQTVFRFILRATGEPALASPLTPANSSNTLSPFVVIAAR